MALRKIQRRSPQIHIMSDRTRIHFNRAYLLYGLAKIHLDCIDYLRIFSHAHRCLYICRIRQIVLLIGFMHRSLLFF